MRIRHFRWVDGKYRYLQTEWAPALYGEEFKARFPLKGKDQDIFWTDGKFWVVRDQSAAEETTLPKSQVQALLKEALDAEAASGIPAKEPFPPHVPPILRMSGGSLVSVPAEETSFAGCYHTYWLPSSGPLQPLRKGSFLDFQQWPEFLEKREDPEKRFEDLRTAAIEAVGSLIKHIDDHDLQLARWGYPMTLDAMVDAIRSL